MKPVQTIRKIRPNCLSRKRKLLLLAIFSGTGMLSGLAKAQTGTGSLAAPSQGEEQNAQDRGVPWEADVELVDKLSSRKDHPFNYREEQVPEYSLPSVFFSKNDTAKAADWPKIRQETLEQFRTHVYGRRPQDTGEIKFIDEGSIVDPTDGDADGKRIVCEVNHKGRSFRFSFLVYLPKNIGEEKVPFVILINNRYLPSPEALKETPDPFWPVQEIVDQGFGTAVFHTSDIDPDRADGYLEGIRGFIAEGKPREEDSWGSLSAWGWGASRVLDYAIEELPIDRDKVAVVGHSRGGKTALWAAAEDPRFAISYSNESGCGGAALSRRRYGETVGRITSAFPHWFCPRFSTYSDQEDRLPVDQHQLIALQAPRAVYVASAAEDLWADPKGEYLSLVYASPVYQLLGEASINTPEMPSLESQRIVGKTGYHIRSGAHNLTLVDWARFLVFAKTQFGGK